MCKRSESLCRIQTFYLRSEFEPFSVNDIALLIRLAPSKYCPFQPGSVQILPPSAGLRPNIAPFSRAPSKYCPLQPGSAQILPPSAGRDKFVFDCFSLPSPVIPKYGSLHSPLTNDPLLSGTTPRTKTIRYDQATHTLYFSLVSWIRIQIESVFRNLVDTDPYSKYGSGSIQVINRMNYGQKV